jgi:class 3 adenylate cyclase
MSISSASLRSSLSLTSSPVIFHNSADNANRASLSTLNLYSEEQKDEINPNINNNAATSASTAATTATNSPTPTSIAQGAGNASDRAQTLPAVREHTSDGKKSSNNDVGAYNSNSYSLIKANRGTAGTAQLNRVATSPLLSVDTGSSGRHRSITHSPRAGTSSKRINFSARSELMEIKDVINYHNKRVENSTETNDSIVVLANSGDSALSAGANTASRYEIIPVDRTVNVSAANSTLTSREPSTITENSNYLSPGGHNSMPSMSREGSKLGRNDSFANIFTPLKRNTYSNETNTIFTENELKFPLSSWRWKLRFPNSTLERHFNSIFYDKYLMLVRLTTLIIMIIDCFAGISDLYVYDSISRHSRTVIWLVRYCSITPASILYLLASKYYSKFYDFRQLITAVYCVFIGIMLMWVSAVGSQPNHGIYMILFNVFSLFYGFNYITSTAVNFCLFVVFNIWNYFVQVVDNESDSGALGEANYSAKHQWLLSFGYLLVTNLMLIVVGYYIELSFRSAYLQHQRLRCERQQTNIVLYNILPKNIALNLVQGIRSADYYPFVSVLFCDIYDFKPLTINLSSEELVAMLNHIYSTFDQILTQKYLGQAIKIETIGEVYVVAAGLPDELDNHAEICCYLALDMIYCMKQFYTLKNSHNEALHYDFKRIKREQTTGIQTKKEKSAGITKQPILFRLGIHSGDVIAGVIGVKLPRYRLFGDTMNTASRMQSTSIAGKIQVSEATFNEVRNIFIFEDRGMISVKGKGELHTYFCAARNVNAEQQHYNSINSAKSNYSIPTVRPFIRKLQDLTQIIKTGSAIAAAADTTAGEQLVEPVSAQISPSADQAEETNGENDGEMVSPLAERKSSAVKSVNRANFIAELNAEFLEVSRSHASTLSTGPDSNPLEPESPAVTARLDAAAAANDATATVKTLLAPATPPGKAARLGEKIIDIKDNSVSEEAKNNHGLPPALVSFLRAKSMSTTDGRLISHFDRSDKDDKGLESSLPARANSILPSLFRPRQDSMTRSGPVHTGNNAAANIEAYEQHNNKIMLSMLKQRRRESKFNSKINLFQGEPNSPTPTSPMNENFFLRTASTRQLYSDS